MTADEYARRESEADAVLDEALLLVTGGLNLDDVKEGVQAGVVTLKNFLRELQRRSAAEEMKAESVGNISKAASQVTKAIDELYRLAQFAKGRPDSRPEAVGDVLGALTAEQRHTVETWVRENAGQTPDRA